MLMEPQRTVMMGVRQPPGADGIAVRAKACACTYLDGHRKR